MILRQLTLAAIVAFAPAAFAQTVPAGKGSPEDLRGATTVFVDESVRGELRDAIVANLRIELPQITVVERAEDAALVLLFSTTIGDDTLLDRSVRSDRTGLVDISKADAAVKPRLRIPPSARPDIVDPSRDMPTGIDAMDTETPQTRTYRYAVGSVLKPSGPNRFVEPFSFKRRIGKETDRAVRDFVRNFAKAYRKANAPEK